jgi:hypothetical protein
MKASTTPHNNFFQKEHKHSKQMSTKNTETTGRVNCMKGVKYNTASAMAPSAPSNKSIKSKKQKHSNKFL